MINQNWYHNHEYYVNITNIINIKNSNVTMNNKNEYDNYNISPYEELKIPCCDNTILFMYYYLQSIITIIIFSLDTPFKKELSQNKYLVFYLVGNVLFAVYIIFIYNTFIYDFFGLINIENQNFKFGLIVVAIINFFISAYANKKLLKYEEEKTTNPEKINLNETIKFKN